MKKIIKQVKMENNHRSYVKIAKIGSATALTLGMSGNEFEGMGQRRYWRP